MVSEPRAQFDSEAAVGLRTNGMVQCHQSMDCRQLTINLQKTRWIEVQREHSFFLKPLLVSEPTAQFVSKAADGLQTNGMVQCHQSMDCRQLTIDLQKNSLDRSPTRALLFSEVSEPMAL